MVDTAPSVLAFKVTIEHVARMKPALIVAEIIQNVKMAVVDLINKKG